jgi:hypothetical protein
MKQVGSVDNAGDSADLLLDLIIAHHRFWRKAGSLEGAGAAGGVIEHESDEGLAVVDFLSGDEREGLGERDAEDFNLFVGFGLRFAWADIAGEVDLHVFAEEAGAGEIFCEWGPAFGAVAGLFDHLAAGGGKGGFTGFDAAGGELEEELAGGVAVLALEDDDGIGLVGAGVVDGKDDDGAVVANDVAGIFVAGGLDDGVGEDGEDLAFIGEFRGDEAGLFGSGRRFDQFEGGGGEGRAGFCFCSSHIATVSSCIGRDVVGIQPDAYLCELIFLCKLCN